MLVNSPKYNSSSLNEANLKKPRKITLKKPDNELVDIFWTSSLEAFFGQETIAPVTNRSIKTLECERWRGLGIPYRKVGGRVLYQKRDVINWLESHALITSTCDEVQHG
jgi:hypothetical protein